MTYGTRFSFVMAAALLAAGCDSGPSGPSQSVEGTWSATGCCMGSQRYELSLTQQGDLIEGVACSMISGTLGVKEVTVSGRYPTVRFDLTGPVIIGGEPRFVVNSFSGKFEADRDQIAGNLGSTPLRFNRISSDGRCSGATPRP